MSRLSEILSNLNNRDMVFEDFLDSDRVRRSKPVVTVSDLQLERLVKPA